MIVKTRARGRRRRAANVSEATDRRATRGRARARESCRRVKSARSSRREQKRLEKEAKKAALAAKRAARDEARRPRRRRRRRKTRIGRAVREIGDVKDGTWSEEKIASHRGLARAARRRRTRRRARRRGGSDRGVRRWEERDGVLSTVSRAPGAGEAGERERERVAKETLPEETVKRARRN